MKNSSKTPIKSITFTVEEMARRLNCSFRGDGNTVIAGVAGLENAGKGSVTFYSGTRYRPQLENTSASAVIVPPGESFSRLPVIFSNTPYATFIQAVDLFFSPYRPGSGIHPTSFISPTAKIGKDVSIGALAYVGDGAVIGDEVVIFPLAAIYPGAKIGRNTVIHSHVAIRENIQVGDNVIIHNGAMIGSDGFGYLQDKEGRHIKIPQTGTVIIEDDVEIGANSCIDRAALESTIIKRGTKIDNLVQIAHNVEVGEDTILASQTGIAGSTKIGKKVITAGQVGIADHLTIGDQVIAAAKTGVTKSLPDKAFVSGSPHLKIQEWRKAWASIPKLFELIREVRKLRKRIDDLENKI